MIPARYQFNRVGDNLTAHKRGTHALCAHGDTVGDGDGIELHRSPAGFTYPALNPSGKLTQMIVARTNFRPGIRNANNGTTKVFVCESHCLEHGARRSPAWSFGNRRAVSFPLVHYKTSNSP